MASDNLHAANTEDIDEDDDDDLRRAIALSLQDQSALLEDDQRDINKQEESNLKPDQGISFGSLVLDRRQMEEERLARRNKRPRSESENDVAIERPDSKRRMNRNSVAFDDLNSVPFPDGTIKRTFVRGYARTGDEITIEEVLQKDILVLALMSSFQWDEAWLLSKVDTSKTKLLLVAFASDDRQKQDMRQNAPKNVRFCFPPMNGPGAMHSKLQLLKYTNYLRVVVPTGNLVPYDWGETGTLENMLFIIDLPLLCASAKQGLQTNFQTQLLQFLRAMGVEESMVIGLDKYDFSSTKDIGFVYSRPGGHTGEAMSSIGYCGLGATVASLGLATNGFVEVDFACASLGALNSDIINALYHACKGDDGMKEYKQRLDTRVARKNRQLPGYIKQYFRIYFPSRGTVDESRGGEDAAGTICFQEKWWRAPGFPVELVRDCINNKEGLLMHSKIILARPKPSPGGENPPRGWVYVGSANLSESAWGRVVKDKSLGVRKINCRNWECGVIIPARGKGSIGGLDSFAGQVPVPMQIPGPAYDGSRQPWFYNSVLR